MSKSVLLNPKVNARLKQFLDDWLGYRASQHLVPGLSVSISCDGQVVYSGAFGTADIQSQAKFTPNHAICMGSQAKMMTAMLVLKLAQEGKLHLHDEARKYLPWLARHKDPLAKRITIEQLLSHRSGLVRDGNDADFWLLEKPFPSHDALRDLTLGSKLTYPSEIQTKYSNLGYALLGRVVEAATGETYEQVANKYIIEPLGLKNTWVNSKSDRPVATGYSRMVNGEYGVLPNDINIATYESATGWFSTPVDMTKIMSLLAGDFLGMSYRDLLLRGDYGHWQPAVPDRGVYGLGLFNTVTENSTIYGHTGGFIGYCSCSYINVEQGVSVAVAINAAYVQVHEIAMGIFGVLEHFQENAAHPTPARLEKFNGTFENLVAIRSVLVLGNSITCVYLDDWAPFDLVDSLLPVDDKTLKISNENFLATPGELVKYQFDSSGNATKVIYAGMSLKPLCRSPIKKAR